MILTKIKEILPYFLIPVLIGSTILQVHSQEYLDKYLEIAANNNPQLKAQFSKYMASLEKVKQNGVLPDPQLSFGYFLTPIETRLGPQQFKVSVTQMFPWFGTLTAQEKSSANIAKGFYEDFINTRNQLFYDVKSAYYKLYVIDKAIKSTNESLDFLRSFKALTTIKYEAGKSSMTNILRVEMEIKELENQLAYLKDNQRALNKKFEELLNIENQFTIIFPDSLWIDDQTILQSNVIDSIIANNPTLKKLDYDIKSWSEKVNIAKKQGMPKFSIGMSYMSIGERNDMNVTGNGTDAVLLPQVGVQIPLYRTKYKAMKKEAVYHEESVRFTKEHKADQFKTTFEKVKRDLQDSRRRIVMFKDLTKLARQTAVLLIADYTAAGNDFEELLRMERKILKYSLELEKARADNNTATAYIHYLMGY